MDIAVKSASEASTPVTLVGRSQLVLMDCFEWLQKQAPNSIDAVVTDPPYGVKEYEISQIERMKNGEASIWRLPPVLNGKVRAPLPRFTDLNVKERQAASEFFVQWAASLIQVLKPGAHVFVASNSFMSQLVFSAIIAGGFEYRTQIVRLVTTLRGGDRPKLGEHEFPDVSVLPRGGFEPWGLFRKPLPKKMTVRECLREYGTGGLRRVSEDQPFFDVIASERTPKLERQIANHPSLKPQSFLRKIVKASLPVQSGVILDPFMGSGSTIAAAEALGYCSIGVERYPEYFDMAINSIPRLAALDTGDNPKLL